MISYSFICCFVLLEIISLTFAITGLIIIPTTDKGKREVGDNMLFICYFFVLISFLDMITLIIICLREISSLEYIIDFLNKIFIYLSLINSIYKICLFFVCNKFYRNTSYFQIKFLREEHKAIYKYFWFIYISTFFYLILIIIMKKQIP